MSPVIPEFAIIADDLTGSLDTGLQFSKKGWVTLVPLRAKSPPGQAQALVINTESRNLPGPLAYRRVFRACRALQARTVYKKIDSTMRGNVGREALAALEALKLSKALVVPAFPVFGRTVAGGILRVNGTPLRRTSYAQDPFHPLSASSVPELLRRETGEPVGHISLHEVRKGPEFLAEKILRSPARLLSLDAVSSSDLQKIAGAWRLLGGKVLPCGSVGLADELCPRGKGVPARERKERRGPLLVVAGSRNPVTAEQIAEARRRDCLPILQPELGRLISPRWGHEEAAEAAQDLLQLLLRNPGAILTTAFLKPRPGKERSIGRALGRLTAAVLRRTPLAGLILTGGDVAMAVCASLAASALRIKEEVLPGIPLSTLVGGPFRGLPLVTKAGGFGRKDALWRIIQHLRGENEEQT